MSLRRRRIISILWALGILASVGLTARGLVMTLTLYGYPDAFERERYGHALIFLGAAASVGSAVWARFRTRSWPVTFAVAAPALLVGLPESTGSDSFVTFFGGILALPAALARLWFGMLHKLGEQGNPGQVPDRPA